MRKNSLEPDHNEDDAFTSVVFIPVADSKDARKVSGAILSARGNQSRYIRTGDNAGSQSARFWRRVAAAVESQDFCEVMLACIENNEAIKNAIRGLTGGAGGTGGTGGKNGGGSETVIPTEVDNTNLIDGGLCTNDNMFAVAVGIADFSFDVITTFYDLLALATQPQEFMAELMDNAPAAATAAPASVLDYIIYMQNTAIAFWGVYDSVPNRETVACDLFCIMQEQECSLTFDDLFEYFNSKSFLPIAGNEVDDIIKNIVSINDPLAFGSTSLAMMYGILAIGGKFGGLDNVGSVLVRVAAFLNDSNDNWEQLCDPCSGTWEHTFNFQNGAQGWSNTNRSLATRDGNGWHQATAQFGVNTWVNGIEIETDIPAATNITDWSMEYDLTFGTWTDTESAISMRYTGSAFLLEVSKGASQVGTGLTQVWSGADNTTTFTMMLLCARHPTPTGTGIATVRSITLSGTGVNPFI